ncbi:hypothetical protein J6590_049006 [Homalodisca vitripennis]|nr:hypothetical protein J6590_049006 [Homalodisca vitripennis]
MNPANREFRTNCLSNQLIFAAKWRRCDGGSRQRAHFGARASLTDSLLSRNTWPQNCGSRLDALYFIFTPSPRSQTALNSSVYPSTSQRRLREEQPNAKVSHLLTIFNIAFGSFGGEFRAKKPSLTLKLGTNGLKAISEPPPMARRAACKDKIALAVTHPSSSHARRCLIWLSCDNRCTRYTAPLVLMKR